MRHPPVNCIKTRNPHLDFRSRPYIRTKHDDRYQFQAVRVESASTFRFPNRASIQQSISALYTLL